MKLKHLQEAGYAAKSIPLNWSEEKVIETFFNFDEEEDGVRTYWIKENFSIHNSNGFNFTMIMIEDDKITRAMSEDMAFSVDLSKCRIYENRQVYGKPHSL